MPSAIAWRLVNRVQSIVDDRRGLHWSSVDEETLRELRSTVASAFDTVLRDTSRECPAGRELRDTDPPGTPVDVVLDNGRVWRTETRSEIWELGGQRVVKLDGRAGGYLVERCTVQGLAAHAETEGSD